MEVVPYVRDNIFFCFKKLTSLDSEITKLLNQKREQDRKEKHKNLRWKNIGCNTKQNN